ncbi:FAD-dependent oxidoreductase [Anaerobacillus sp. HL2]|nr:FAD-dependent oxidoreductase [Anaerobacillus sp. HL2]
MLAAIHVPSTGIVNFKQVAKTYAKIIEQRGGEIWRSTEVIGITSHQEGVDIEQIKEHFKCLVINCGGLIVIELQKSKYLNRFENRSIPWRIF